MLNLYIIKNLLKYDVYTKYRHYIHPTKDEKELNHIYAILDNLINQYQRDITFDELELSVLSQYPEYDFLIEQLSNAEIDPAIIQQTINSITNRSLAHQLALLAIDVSEGKKDMEDILTFYTKLTGRQQQEHIEWVTDDLEEIYNETVHKPGLRWRLPTLNRMLGSLRKGDFGFIFARPETGKTTFLASEVTHFAHQAESEILWFNNEEQGSKVKTRCYQATLACDLTKLYSDRSRANELFIKKTGGKIKIFDNAAVHRKQVENLCKSMQPSLIIFDQIDKIRGFHNDRKDLELGDVYIWARELAKTYAPVIGVCQADASGEGKKWLDMGNVSNAKCLTPSTKVLMYNGNWRRIDQIEVGEQVMGVDSTPRNVLDTAYGEEEMYSVQHKIGGDTYVVNKAHILSLITNSGKYIDKNVLSYNKSDFGYRVGHELPEQSLPIDPYFLGIWLGDGGKDKAEITTIDPEIIQTVRDECNTWGCTYTQYLEQGHIVHARMRYKQGVKHPFLNKLKELDLFKRKHIPSVYFKGSIQQRLSLIAGLLDTDGTKVVRKHEYYVFSNANYLLALGLKDLALSCGLMATFKQRGKYYYTSISGNDLSVIPCRIARKKSDYKGYKDVLKSRLIINTIGIGEYAGILIDGDHKFIIENNIVTHNTSKQAEADWILGIGKTNEIGMEHIRYLHLSKNKLSGDEDTVPELRHGRCEVVIKPNIARYAEIGDN